MRKFFNSIKKEPFYSIILIFFLSLFAIYGVIKSIPFSTPVHDSTPVIAEEELPTLSIPEEIEEEPDSYYAPASLPAFYATSFVSAATCRSSKSCFTDVDAGYGVVQYESTYFYGHSNAAFHRLKTLYTGDLFEMTDISGNTRTYRVAVRTVQSKNYLNTTGKNNGFTSGIYSANYYGVQYNIALMTCGNGANNDSNYRLILFAEAV